MVSFKSSMRIDNNFLTLLKDNSIEKPPLHTTGTPI